MIQSERALRRGSRGRLRAPLAVNDLDFPGTTEADSISYIIADRRATRLQNMLLLPRKSSSFGLRSGQRLQRCTGESVLSRRERGLPDDGVIFCRFNGSDKIMSGTFNL